MISAMTSNGNVKTVHDPPKITTNETLADGNQLNISPLYSNDFKFIYSSNEMKSDAIPSFNGGLHTKSEQKQQKRL